MPAHPSSSPVPVYQQTNRWLQDLARKAGAGKALWPPKPSVGNATEIVNAFLSYQKMTTGVLERFMDSYLQFEKAGRTFHTEHAFTKAIMEDSASCAVEMPDRNLVAFVSTSPYAVSSDALFLRLTLDALETGNLVNPISPSASASIQSGRTQNQHASVSAQASMGASIFSMFKASATAAAEASYDNQTLRQVSVTGKAGIDAKDRSVLSCLSTVYAMEQSGILSEGRFMDSLIRLSGIAAEKTGNAQVDIEKSKELLTNPERSIGVINDAMRQGSQIRDFLLPFCADHLRLAHDEDRRGQSGENPAKAFWSEALLAVKGRKLPESTLKMLTRYADHQDDPAAGMVVALLRTQNMLSGTRKAASEFLMTARRSLENNYRTSTLQPGDIVMSVAVSPIVGLDKALVVVEDDRDGLCTKCVPLSSVANMLPEIRPMLTEFGGEFAGNNMMIDNNQWDAALEAMAKVNDNIGNAMSQNEVFVIQGDLNFPGNLGITKCRGDLFRADRPGLDGMSPFD